MLLRCKIVEKNIVKYKRKYDLKKNIFIIYEKITKMDTGTQSIFSKFEIPKGVLSLYPKT